MVLRAKSDPTPSFTVKLRELVKKEMLVGCLNTGKDECFPLLYFFMRCFKYDLNLACVSI